MSESRNWLSPYNYVQNNPIIRIDPTGMVDDYYANDDGSIKKVETNDNFDRFYVEKQGKFKQVAQLDKHKAADGKTDLVNFPSTGEGFTRYGEADKGGDHSVQPEVAAALFGAINEITTNDPTVTVRLGDMSGFTGGKPGEEHIGGTLSHFNGRNVDVGLIRTDKALLGSNVNSPTFDFSSNQAAVNSYNKFGFKSILSQTNATGIRLNNTINDPKGGHFDHLHLQRFTPRIK